ncbi:MAG: hypothetical protein ACK4L4_06545 [Gemmobacter sp.]
MTKFERPFNGRKLLRLQVFWTGGILGVALYPRKDAKALVRDAGIETACIRTGRSTATLGRNCADAAEHAGGFTLTCVVTVPVTAARFPLAISALADWRGILMFDDKEHRDAQSSGINEDVVALVHRFDILMAETASAISDGRILYQRGEEGFARNAGDLHEALMMMKLNLQDEAAT